MAKRCRARAGWIALGGLVLVACGGGSSSGVPDELRAETDDVAAGDCATPVEGVSDLAAEPEITANRFRWQDSRGCDVRIDVIANSFVDDHCEGDAVEIMGVGTPLGEQIDTGGRIFYWDPDNALMRGDGTATMSVSDLPPTAVDTGFRRGDMELWTDNNQPEILLRVRGDDVEILQLDSTGLTLCA